MSDKIKVKMVGTPIKVTEHVFSLNFHIELPQGQKVLIYERTEEIKRKLQEVLNK